MVAFDTVLEPSIELLHSFKTGTLSSSLVAGLDDTDFAIRILARYRSTPSPAMLQTECEDLELDVAGCQ